MLANIPIIPKHRCELKELMKPFYPRISGHEFLIKTYNIGCLALTFIMEG